MDTKAVFEKWIKDENETNWRELLRIGMFGKYFHESTSKQWKAWRASRAAIEIKLPDGDISPSMHMTQRVMMNARDVVKAITSHGIRIKGKTE